MDSVHCCLYLQCVLHGVYICSVCCYMLASIIFSKSYHILILSYSVNHTIYLYLVSININCTNNIDVTHCLLSLICVFCFVTMYMLFSVFISVSLYFVLLFCSFYFSSKTYMKNKILSTHSQQGEDEDPMV